MTSKHDITELTDVELVELIKTLPKEGSVDDLRKLGFRFLLDELDWAD